MRLASISSKYCLSQETQGIACVPTIVVVVGMVWTKLRWRVYLPKNKPEGGDGNILCIDKAENRAVEMPPWERIRCRRYAMLWITRRREHGEGRPCYRKNDVRKPSFHPDSGDQRSGRRTSLFTWSGRHEVNCMYIPLSIGFLFTEKKN